ncbi:SH3 domain-containing protein [Persephonella sp.]
MKRLFLILLIAVMVVVDAYFIKQLLFSSEENKKLTASRSTENPVPEIENKQGKNTPEKPEETKQPSAEKKIQNTVVAKPEPKQNSAPVKRQVGSGYMIAKVYVNLRKAPDVNSEIVAVIKKGSSVKVIGKKANHWKRVLYRENERVYEGWVDDRFFIKGESLKSQ